MPETQFAEVGIRTGIGARQTRWDDLLSIPPGNPGWVEVRAYDAYVLVRMVRRYALGVEPDTDAKPIRIGPGGSAHLFRIEDGGTIEYSVACEMSGHVDVGTGIHEVNGSNVPKVTARFTRIRPATWTVQQVSFINTYGDAPAVFISAESARVFPTMYAREYTFRSVSPTGQLHVKTGLIGGQAGGGVFDTTTGTDILEPFSSGELDPWQSIVIQNEHTITALVCSLSLRSPTVER